MDTHSFILVLLLVFVGARVFGELFAYFGMVAVLGEIFAGLVLGPSGCFRSKRFFSDLAL
jgi:Kef-type K+ transport system membrane component KefB